MYTIQTFSKLTLEYLMLQLFYAFSSICPSVKYCSWILEPQTLSVTEEWYEPTREIMTLFVPRKFTLQILMRSRPMGIHVYFLSDPLSTSILYVCEQRKLWRCAVSPEPSLAVYVITTIITWAGSYCLVTDMVCLYAGDIFFCRHLKLKTALNSFSCLIG